MDTVCATLQCKERDCQSTHFSAAGRSESVIWNYSGTGFPNACNQPLHPNNWQAPGQNQRTCTTCQCHGKHNQTTGRVAALKLASMKVKIFVIVGTILLSSGVSRFGAVAGLSRRAGPVRVEPLL